ncbi:MAG: polyphosphate kinase 2 family protein [Planctomycetota bacterium]|nr:polyphosphate kinase 2 family protein [Planctomycetota bacterium]
MKLDIDSYRVKPGKKGKVDLAEFRTDDDGGLQEADAAEEVAGLRTQLFHLQERLYAEGSRSLLAVFQAMDGGGKDSTIRNVFTAINPEGVRVESFKAPNDEARAHDYLWRVHRALPPRGFIGVFNRSHYEDVLIARVKGLAPRHRWEKRYDHINDFERMLRDEGTHVVKFFIHISKEYQKRRLLKRLASPQKLWKFNPADLVERERWDKYQKAYGVALSRCSTGDAPWYVIPGETRWFRDLLVSRVLVETLTAMKLEYPRVSFDPRKIKVV